MSSCVKKLPNSLQKGLYHFTFTPAMSKFLLLHLPSSNWYCQLFLHFSHSTGMATKQKTEQCEGNRNRTKEHFKTLINILRETERWWDHEIETESIRRTFIKKGRVLKFKMWPQRYKIYIELLERGVLMKQWGGRESRYNQEK